MRGNDEPEGHLFSYVSLEKRVRADHPLRQIRMIVDDCLAGMDDVFSGLYARVGRPSIAPEKLIRALLCQAFFSVRSERQLMEQLDYNLLFRWFVGLGVDDPVWDASTFSKNRDRLLDGDVAQALLTQIITHPRVKPLLSSDHFSVDGTLIAAWASQKSFVPKDGSGGSDTGGRNAECNFHGQMRSNDTHESTTDPDVRLYKKSKGSPAILCHMGHAITENRHGLAVAGEVTHATGTAERNAALAMTARLPGAHKKTLGADKGYDANDFITGCRAQNITPHVARHSTRRNIDRRTTRHAGYAVSQKKRKIIEELFGWAKTVGTLAKTMFRGTARVDASFKLNLAAYNLVRLPKLLANTT
jgi:transposase